MVEGLTDEAEPLEAGALVVIVPPRGFEDIGGVLLSEGTSSIGSSLTGVASPLSTDCDGSGSSPVLFLFTFFVFRTLVLVFVPDEEEDGGWCGGGPLSSLPLLPLP